MSEALDSEEIRQMLKEERRAILERSTDQEKETISENVSNLDRSDLAQDYTERERHTASLAQAEERLAQIEKALQRLDNGTYGKCEVCGKEINPERLKVLPHTTMCVECKEEENRRTGQ